MIRFQFVLLPHK